MSNIDNIILVMDAIKQVKLDASRAAKEGDFAKYKESMENLLVLENCLVTEVNKGLKAA